MYKVSLRSRIILALVVIVTVTSTLFATGVLLIKSQLEAVIFGNMVRDQLEVISMELDQGIYDVNSLYNNWQLYTDENIQSLPVPFQSLPAGSYHSIIANERYYQLEVGSRNNQPIYLSYDITDWENQEHELLELLIYGVGIVLIAAIIMGRQASLSILAPVKSLTRRLASIQPKDRNVRIAQDYQGNEIGQIATAFDRYLERLDQFVDRERSFTAAASHELRTPLSVMMGAIDVLEENSRNAPSQRALARIKRACAEMLAFIEATLFLSREDSSTINQSEPADVAAIINSLVEDSASALEAKNITLETSITASPVLTEPASIIQITIGNILRNAIEHTVNGSIHISLNKDTLSIRDTGCGIPKESLPHIFDRSFTTKPDGTGLGLNLVKRICDRFDWKLAIESEVGSGTHIVIQF